MRTEKEMYDLILNTAREDENIRAVLLNGSRTNPAVKADPLQDFDIVYFVDDLSVYKEGGYNVDCDFSKSPLGLPEVSASRALEGKKADIFMGFGEILIMERTDVGELYNENDEEYVCYLMQFKDGNRIDLTITHKSLAEKYALDDRLGAVLLDKDGIMPTLPPPSDFSHHIKRPSRRLFNEVFVEFWWVAPHVAKGLWRGQRLYAHRHLNDIVIGMLTMMLSWYVGTKTEFSVTAGKKGDNLELYLEKDLWHRYLSCYTGTDIDKMWEALFTACGIFEEIGKKTAGSLGYGFDDVTGKSVTEYLHHIKAMPKDA